MDDTTESRAVRLGVIPGSGDESGCETCRHPFSLHGNGKTECKALRCAGGPNVECPTCGGLTVNLVTGEACETCKGNGTVGTPCPSFADAAPSQDELIAS